MSRLNLGQLYIQLAVETKALKVAEKEVKRSTEKMGSSAKKAKSNFTSLGSVIGGLVSLEAIRRVALFQDKMIGLQLQIKDMTRDTGDFAKVEKELYQGNRAIF